jgi:hypothetical protein
MKVFISLVLLFSVALSTVPGDGIEGCTGNENPFPLITTPPTLTSSVPNGKRY